MCSPRRGSVGPRPRPRGQGTRDASGGHGRRFCRCRQTTQRVARSLAEGLSSISCPDSIWRLPAGADGAFAGTRSAPRLGPARLLPGRPWRSRRRGAGPAARRSTPAPISSSPTRRSMPTISSATSSRRFSSRRSAAWAIPRSAIALERLPLHLFRRERHGPRRAPSDRLRRRGRAARTRPPSAPGARPRAISRRPRSR